MFLPVSIGYMTRGEAQVFYLPEQSIDWGDDGMVETARHTNVDRVFLGK